MAGEGTRHIPASGTGHAYPQQQQQKLHHHHHHHHHQRYAFSPSTTTTNTSAPNSAPSANHQMTADYHLPVQGIPINGNPAALPGVATSQPHFIEQQQQYQPTSSTPNSEAVQLAAARRGSRSRLNPPAFAGGNPLSEEAMTTGAPFDMSPQPRGASVNQASNAPMSQLSQSQAGPELSPYAQESYMEGSASGSGSSDPDGEGRDHSQLDMQSPGVPRAMETSAEAGGQGAQESEKKKVADKPRLGRRKIVIEFIEDKAKRQITFSKRKHGLMKKAVELSTLTGTEVLLLVASETGHVYTFASPKLQALVTEEQGKNLIQSCLNAPDPPVSGMPPTPGRGPTTPNAGFARGSQRSGDQLRTHGEPSSRRGKKRRVEGSDTGQESKSGHMAQGGSASPLEEMNSRARTASVVQGPVSGSNPDEALEYQSPSGSAQSHGGHLRVVSPMEQRHLHSRHHQGGAHEVAMQVGAGPGMPGMVGTMTGAAVRSVGRDQKRLERGTEYERVVPGPSPMMTRHQEQQQRLSEQVHGYGHHPQAQELMLAAAAAGGTPANAVVTTSSAVAAAAVAAAAAAAEAESKYLPPPSTHHGAPCAQQLPFRHNGGHHLQQQHHQHHHHHRSHAPAPPPPPPLPPPASSQPSSASDMDSRLLFSPSPASGGE